MSKKGETFTFICENIIEATPDFILYNIKEDSGGYANYIEEHSDTHLMEHGHYEATVGNVLMKPVYTSYFFLGYLMTELTVNSIGDDTIKDKLIYKIDRRMASLLIKSYNNIKNKKN